MKNWSEHLKIVLGVLVLAVICAVSASAKMSEESLQCMDCHADMMPGLVDQWQDSNHWQAGVGCYECHGAKKGESDAMDHNGFLVATIVSPKDCAKCHPKESAEQEASHHARAGEILNTKDGLLGQTVGGAPAVAVCCRQCHGSLVKVLPERQAGPVHLAEHRYRPDQSRRDRGILRRMPQPPRVFRRPGAPPRHLPKMSPGT